MAAPLKELTGKEPARIPGPGIFLKTRPGKFPQNPEGVPLLTVLLTSSFIEETR